MKRQQPLPMIVEGFFYQKVESRDFYCLLSKTDENKFKWFFDIMPSSGQTHTIKGDSGSLLCMPDGQALALCVGTSWKEFYEKNLEIAKHLKKLREETHSLNNEELFLKEIHTHVALKDNTKKTILENGEMLYRFMLKSHLPILKATNYFTSLNYHLNFIQSFIRDNHWQTFVYHPRHPDYQKIKNKLKMFSPKNITKAILDLETTTAKLKLITREILIKLNQIKTIANENKEAKMLEINKDLTVCTELQSKMDGLQSILKINDNYSELLVWWNQNKKQLRSEISNPSVEQTQKIKQLNELGDQLTNLTISHENL